MKLGKKPYKFDERTAKMARFMDTTLRAPVKFDFDHGRRSFPYRIWGNDRYGDCVFANEANHLLRLDRAESRRTLSMGDNDVISTYKTLTGCKTAGDSNDEGYVMLDAYSWWRHSGWGVGEHNYTIDAYGELEPSDPKQMRLGCYLLHGIGFGFSLPLTAQSQTGHGFWDVVEGSGSQAGSWGGHAVYGKKYDQESWYVITWGKEIRVSNAFVDRYCDEAWVVVDSLDTWRKHPAFDVALMENYLTEIGAKRGEQG